MAYPFGSSVTAMRVGWRMLGVVEICVSAGVDDERTPSVSTTLSPSVPCCGPGVASQPAISRATRNNAKNTLCGFMRSPPSMLYSIDVPAGWRVPTRGLDLGCIPFDVAGGLAGPYVRLPESNPLAIWPQISQIDTE